MFVTTIPGTIQAAGAALASISGAAVATNAAVAVPLTANVPVAADDVSAFNSAAHQETHAGFQASAGAGWALFETFVADMFGAGDAYDFSEAINAAITT